MGLVSIPVLVELLVNGKDVHLRLNHVPRVSVLLNKDVSLFNDIIVIVFPIIFIISAHILMCKNSAVMAATAYEASIQNRVSDKEQKKHTDVVSNNLKPGHAKIKVV